MPLRSWFYCDFKHFGGNATNFCKEYPERKFRRIGPALFLTLSPRSTMLCDEEKMADKCDILNLEFAPAKKMHRSKAKQPINQKQHEH